MMYSMPFKFFPKDVIEGQMKAPGDHFTAVLMGGVGEFMVEENHGGWVEAYLCPPEECTLTTGGAK